MKLTETIQRSYSKPDNAGWRYAAGWRCRREVDGGAPSVGVYEIERWNGTGWVKMGDTTTYADARRVIA